VLNLTTSGAICGANWVLNQALNGAQLLAKWGAISGANWGNFSALNGEQFPGAISY
jgi:hypothetical protein